MRLLVDGGPPIAGGIIGAGGEIAWPQPTRPGDTLQVHSEVVDIRPSRSRPDRGIVILSTETRNQRDEVVQTFVARLVVRRRSPDVDASGGQGQRRMTGAARVAGTGGRVPLPIDRPERRSAWLGRLCSSSTAGCAESRLQRVRKRGHLVCGVSPGVAGFATVDGQGQYAGLDVDICRAMAAAIFATPDKVRYVEATSVDQFVRSPDVDVVSRRLTWTLQREGLGLLFGPVTFYDGQGFLVSRALRATTVAQLANTRICVVPGNINQFNLNEYFETRGLSFRESQPALAGSGGSGALDRRLRGVDRGPVRARSGAEHDAER